MKYLLDTHWVVSYLNGRQEAFDLISSLRQDGLAISYVTYAEVYQGVYYGKDPKDAERGFLEFLSKVEQIPINKSVLKIFSRIRGELKSQGRLIADMDLLIASTAIHHNLILVTRNLRDFGRIPNLAIYQES